MIIHRWTYLLIGLFISGFVAQATIQKFNFNPEYEVGQKIDSLNGVFVYYNGEVDNVIERNTTKDGYNLGLKYQCVEFVKRYFFEHLNHKMPDSYGHAKDFYDKNLADGEINKRRNLTQYSNPSRGKPQVDDLLIYDETELSKYGHVAIVSRVSKDEIEIIQQNPGLFEKSRESFTLESKDGNWKIGNERILGWLRKDSKNKKFIPN